MELLTGLGLATAAGLNAYIPLLALGLLAALHRPGVAAGRLGLAGERLGAGDRRGPAGRRGRRRQVPALDSVNDTIQTFVRPTAGGIVFGSGTAAQTAAVTDPGAFAQSGQWIPVAIGVVVALVVSLTKSTVRPAANVATAGMAAPVLSTVEDVTSIVLVFLAILLPVLVLVAVIAAGVGGGQADPPTAPQSERTRVRSDCRTPRAPATSLAA